MVGAMSAQGEDRSDFQPVTPVGSLDFIFYKATEGLTWESKTYPANIAQARSESKPLGSYHFLHPGLSGAAQARFFLDFIRRHGGLRDGDQLVVDSELMAGVQPASPRSHLGLDLGHPPGPAAFALAVSGVDACTKLFLDTLHGLVNPGKHPLLTYTMGSVGQHLHATASAHPLLWFARPGITAPTAAQIAPWKHWRYWQWGIVRNVDKDAYNGLPADLKRWLSGYTQAGPFRHVADGTKTLAEIAAGRHTDPQHLLEVTAKAYTPGDIAAATALKAPAGLPYYTVHP